VAFLSCDQDAEINAHAVFARMKGTPLDNVRARFDHWIGCQVHDKYHHGWPGHKKYGECYCFRWYEKEARHRFYGFKFHPSKSNPGFQVCVLVSHARKFDDATDLTELDRAVRLRADETVVAAIRKEFPENKKQGSIRWN